MKQERQILLVEDDLLHFELVARAFKRHDRPFHIFHATSIQEADKVLSKNNVDIILADLMLPDGEGTQLIEIGSQKNIPVIMSTCRGDEESAVNAMKKGAVDYVVKDAQAIKTMPQTVERALAKWQQILTEEHEKLELKESERWYRSLFDNNRSIMLLIEPRTGQIIDANPPACKFHGCTRQEMTKKRLHDLFALPQAEMDEQLDQVAHQDMGVFFSYHRLASGEIRQVEIATGHVVVAEQEFILAIIHDVTDYARAQEALKRSEARYALAQKAAGIGSWDWNIKTGELFWSETIEPIFGFKPGAFKGTYEAFVDCLHPDDRKRVESEVRAAITSDKDYAIDHRIIHPNGDIRWLRELGRVFKNDSGEADHMLGIVQDVTEQKQNDVEREKLMESLERKNDELQTLMSVISHDVGNPLFSIRAFCAELGNCIKDLEQAMDYQEMPTELKQRIQPILEGSIPEAIGYINEGASEIGKLLEGLRTVAKVGRLPLDLETQDVNEVVAKIKGTMKHQIEQAHAEIIIEGLPKCIADSTQLNQVFTNLIGNALKYFDPARQGLITISGCKDQDMSVYKIEDNGIGIEPHQQEKVFEIFHRVNPDTIHGEGLGLTIVKRILDRHNGNIWLTSEPGIGTTFFIALPTAED